MKCIYIDRCRQDCFLKKIHLLLGHSFLQPKELISTSANSAGEFKARLVFKKVIFAARTFLLTAEIVSTSAKSAGELAVIIGANNHMKLPDHISLEMV